GLELLLGQALLMGVTQEGVQRRAVILETIGPEIRPHLAPCLFDMGGKPRQHLLERRLFVKIPVRFLLRGAKSLVQRLRDPSMLLVELASDYDRVHDRKNTRAPVVVLLD